MRTLGTEWGDVWVAAGGIVSALTVVTVAGRVLGLDRVWRWFTRHVEEDRRNRFVAAVVAAVGPRLNAMDIQLTELNRRTSQLCPNGGTSMYDRMSRVEDRLEEVAVIHGIRQPPRE